MACVLITEAREHTATAELKTTWELIDFQEAFLKFRFKVLTISFESIDGGKAGDVITQIDVGAYFEALKVKVIFCRVMPTEGNLVCRQRGITMS